MLLGNKKKQGEEQNWCIVLSPLRNEIDKKRVAKTISEVFSLSTEEAADLVSNTPIILLDNLTRTVAIKVKEYFRVAGAEIILTNDIFYKRKCYRTVWPDPPNLAILQNLLNGNKEAPASDRELPPQEALQEIRSLQMNPGITHEPDTSSWSPARETSLKYLREELEKWRKECLSRRTDVENLQAALNRLQKEKGEMSIAQQGAKNSQVMEAEKRLKEITASLASSEDRYDALKEEFRQARLIFEEKMAAAVREKDEPKDRIKAMEEKMRILYERNQALERSLGAANEELKKNRGIKSETPHSAEAVANIQKLETENSRLRQELSELRFKQDELMKKNEAGEALSEDLLTLKAQRETHERARVETEQKLKEVQNELSEKMQEIERLRAEVVEKQDLLQLRLEESGKDGALWKDRALEMEKRIVQIDESKKALSHSLETSRIAQEEIRGQYEEVLAKYNALAVQYDKGKLDALKNDETLKVLESSRKELSSQLEVKSQKVRDYESRIGEFEKELAGLRQNVSQLERLLQQRTTSLRDKELALEAQARESQSMIRQLEDREKSFLELQAVSRSLEEQLKQFRSSHEELEKTLLESRLQLEAGAEQLVAAQRQTDELRNQMHEKEKALGEARVRYERLERVLTEGREAYEKQGKQFYDLQRQLESRDREVDNLRKQLRDINVQMEQREMIQKRTQLTGQLSEKEEQLKRLVDQQNRVEVEIRQREETMRQILTLQESLEKEIVEVRQVQRHLMEQAKKSAKAVSSHPQKGDPLSPSSNASAAKDAAGSHD